MESIVGAAGKENTAVKRKMSDTHDERSETTDETVDNLDITKNVSNKPA